MSEQKAQMEEEFPASSERMQAYFKRLTSEVDRSYEVAGRARAKGLDPEDKVDIPQAKNMAERVVGLISIVAPQLVGTQLIPRIGELEEQYGLLDWRVALKIAEETAAEKFCTFKDKQEALEIGVRVGFTYHTLGIVAAPLEGFIGLKIKKTRDGKEYLASCYAGPIRGAGGTAASFSVILVDYLRKKFGYAAYDPDEKEVNRFITEIRDYHERVTNLQYYPSEEEIKFLVSHISVEVDGDPTEKREVSNHKDLPRVETNLIRGGICLVLAEGISQKAPKLWKRLSKWGKEMDLDQWDFLDEFLTLQKKIKAGKESEKGEKTEEKISKNFTFIKDMVAGRPVLTHPLEPGGFRLRYGRARVTGFSAGAICPASQAVLDDYIGIGTQVKTERPGKACSLTVCHALEGPIVRLSDGSVKQFRTAHQAKNSLKDVEEVIFVGDILTNYGDFSENNHPLVPAGYCPEWWLGEIAKALGHKRDEVAAHLSEKAGISPEDAEALGAWYSQKVPPLAACEKVSRTLGVPLHPSHIHYWKLLSLMEARQLITWLLKRDEKEDGKWVLPLKAAEKRYLEHIGAEHDVSAGEWVAIAPETARALALALGLDTKKEEEIIATIEKAVQDKKSTLDVINSLSSMKIRDKAGTFIGCRMGRPEKSKMRKLTGSPHTLFPVGREGGRLRSFNEALEKGVIKADFPLFECPECKSHSAYRSCHRCGTHTKLKYYCRKCQKELLIPECPAHGPIDSYRYMEIPFRKYFEQAVSLLGEPVYPDLIKGVRGTSNKDHIPEHFFKGLLRAKHEINVNKDGTTRYDITELPITHFTPKEIDTPVEKLRELGYTKDTNGKPLEHDMQVCEIFPQDIVLPANLESFEEAADEVLLRVAAFVDEMLVKLYGLEPYYNLKEGKDLVGHLVIGLAPHISAGTMGRIIGFSRTQGCYAHPLWHAALRRDCDGDECSVILLMDALLNFSRQYLPDRRGSRTMDSPLVLTVVLNPSEVDDMAHGLDIVWEYPPEFYEATLEYTHPKEFKVEQLAHRLDTPGQYEGMGFTHPVKDMNEGVLCSAYKTIPTMMEKLQGQMLIAERLRAVDEADVARLVIEKHFIKDIKGNLRKFSLQQFRCIACNEKYPRPPLAGHCTKPRCGGKLVFTIAEGSVVKYLEPSISLAHNYNLPAYLQETLKLTKQRIESVFGKKEQQLGLGKWFG